MERLREVEGNIGKRPIEQMVFVSFKSPGGKNQRLRPKTLLYTRCQT
ncbi:MAG TPA: hypothetical protein VE134_00915 [Methanomicrobiales archaeon]|nr:hypothetical protein [Methanomicrobiales archaeon]